MSFSDDFESLVEETKNNPADVTHAGCMAKAATRWATDTVASVHRQTLGSYEFDNFFHVYDVIADPVRDAWINKMVQAFQLGMNASAEVVGEAEEDWHQYFTSRDNWQRAGEEALTYENYDAVKQVFYRLWRDACGVFWEGLQLDALQAGTLQGMPDFVVQMMIGPQKAWDFFYSPMVVTGAIACACGTKIKEMKEAQEEVDNTFEQMIQRIMGNNSDG